MNLNIKKIIKNKFIKNVIIMATGTAAAQFISLLFTPIITRLYGPEAYGLMGVFMAFLAIFTPIAALTYPVAIVLPKKDNHAKELALLSIYTSICVGGTLLIILLFYKQTIIKLFNVGAIAQFLFLIPILIIFAGLQQIMEYWLIRKKKFGIVAKIPFYHTSIIQGSKVGVGFFYPTTNVLIYLSAFGISIQVIILYYYINKIKKINLFTLFKSVDVIALKNIAKRYKDFPLFRSPQALIDAISQNLPILLLTSFFGPASAGFYTIGRTVLNLPAQLIGKSVGDVFYPRISEARNNSENLKKLIIKSTTALAIFGAVPFSLVILFGPWMFGFVFGDEWKTAGEYARWLALWLFFMFINGPSNRAIPVLSLQALQLRYSIITIILRLISLWIGYYYFNSDKIAVALFAIISSIRTFAFTLIIIRKSRKYS